MGCLTLPLITFFSKTGNCTSPLTLRSFNPMYYFAFGVWKDELIVGWLVSPGVDSMRSQSRWDFCPCAIRFPCLGQESSRTCTSISDYFMISCQKKRPTAHSFFGAYVGGSSCWWVSMTEAGSKVYSKLRWLYRNCVLGVRGRTKRFFFTLSGYYCQLYQGFTKARHESKNKNLHLICGFHSKFKVFKCLNLNDSHNLFILY